MLDCAISFDLGHDHAAPAPSHVDAGRSDAALALVAAAGDDVWFLGAAGEGLIYVVAHRSNGAWTHVYRIVRDRRSRRPAVFVEKVIEGERLSAARDWAWRRFAMGADR